MNPQAAIALAALLSTLLIGLIVAAFRAGVLLTNVKRDIAAVKLDVSAMQKDLKDIRENHLAHIEIDLAELRSR